MATTEKLHTGDDSSTLFNFTFEYLNESDIKVSLDGVDQITTEYSVENATNIRFVTAPGNGVAIRIYRQTAQDAPPATFFAGSAIRASDLNENFLQQLYIAQETANITVAASTGNLAEDSITGFELANNAVSTNNIVNSAVTSAQIADGTIVNADVNASAAIAGTKVSPSFGSQNIVTTGDVSADNITATGNVTATGDISGDNITTTGDISGDNITVTGNATVTNNLTVNGTGNQSIAGTLKFDSGYGSVATAYGCRAWVNFDGITNNNLTGTYSQVATDVTVTVVAHGLIVGDTIYVDITSGTGVDGTYTVATVTDADTFTYTAGTSKLTSGNITLRRNTIRGSGNISSIADLGTGSFRVNFITAMPDVNYACLVNASSLTDAVTIVPGSAVDRSTSGVRVDVETTAAAQYNAAQIDLSVFR
jgi:hypothetical protein